MKRSRHQVGTKDVQTRLMRRVKKTAMQSGKQDARSEWTEGWEGKGDIFRKERRNDGSEEAMWSPAGSKRGRGETTVSVQ